MGEIYEEYLPIESELEAKSVEFRALFFQVLGLFEYVKEGQDGPKTRKWYREWYNGAKRKSNFFKGDGFFRKVRKARARTNYPSSFDFHHCRDF